MIKPDRKNNVMSIDLGPKNIMSDKLRNKVASRLLAHFIRLWETGDPENFESLTFIAMSPSFASALPELSRSMRVLLAAEKKADAEFRKFRKYEMTDNDDGGVAFGLAEEASDTAWVDTDQYLTVACERALEGEFGRVPVQVQRAMLAQVNQSREAAGRPPCRVERG